jgi:hypothetical protein
MLRRCRRIFAVLPLVVPPPSCGTVPPLTASCSFVFCRLCVLCVADWCSIALIAAAS